MNYNEAYRRLMQLDDLRALDLDAASLSETLILRAAYTGAVARFAAVRQTIEADTQGDDSARTAAIEAAAAEDCGLADRRFTPVAFAGIVSAALAAGTVRTSLAPEPLPAATWLEILVDNLVDTNQ